MKQFIVLTDYEGDPLVIDVADISMLEVHNDGPHEDKHDPFDPDCVCSKCHPEIKAQQRQWWSRSDVVLKIVCCSGDEEEHLLVKAVRETVLEITSMLNEGPNSAVIGSWKWKELPLSQSETVKPLE